MITNVLTLRPGTEVLVNDQDVFDALIENRGNLELTRELLSKRYQTIITRTQIIEAVKDRLPDLKEYMEAYAAMELFALMPTMSSILLSKLTDMETSEAIEAFLGVHKLVSAKVDTQRVDITHRDERFWKFVPDQVRDVWAQLRAQDESVEQTG